VVHPRRLRVVQARSPRTAAKLQRHRERTIATWHHRGERDGHWRVAARGYADRDSSDGAAESAAGCGAKREDLIELLRAHAGASVADQRAGRRRQQRRNELARVTAWVEAGRHEGCTTSMPCSPDRSWPTSCGS